MMNRPEEEMEKSKNGIKSPLCPDDVGPSVQKTGIKPELTQVQGSNEIVARLSDSLKLKKTLRASIASGSGLKVEHTAACIVLKFNICSARRFAGQIYLIPYHSKKPCYGPLSVAHVVLDLYAPPHFVLLRSISCSLEPQEPQSHHEYSVGPGPLDLYIKVGRRQPRALPNGSVIYGPVRSDKQEYNANEIWTISLGRNHVFKPRPYLMAPSTTLIWKMETIEPSQQGIYLGVAQFKSEEQKTEAFNRYYAIQKEGIVGKLDSLNEIIEDLKKLNIVAWGDVKWEGMYTEMKALLRIPLAG
ncbi:hypothetical protein GG344DRAFT_65132 [Lentinula edodes]|nr:hypothetical protein GG344DRAFT_65132 [Lentinula edodes]